MFQNIGKTLSVVGKVLFWLFVAAGVILFIAYGVANSQTELAILLGSSGIVSAFLFALPICGFGRLVHDVSALKEKLVNSQDSQT